MKIYNIAEFEKLKIRAVNVSDLNVYPGHIKEIDPERISYSDLKPGDIIKTNENKAPFYMAVGKNAFQILLDYPTTQAMMFVQPDNIGDIVYLTANRYKANWPHVDSTNADLNIIKVYKTDCDVSKINSMDDFYRIYNEYIKYIESEEMKIYDTNIFEKLKIRPVDVNSLKNDIAHDSVKMMDADNLGFSDLCVGYFVRTNEARRNNPFYMVFDVETFMELGSFLDDYSGSVNTVLVQPEPNKTDYSLCYLSMENYMNNFPFYERKYSYSKDSKFDIIKVYITHCDVSNIKTNKDFVEIYNKYMQYIEKL